MKWRRIISLVLSILLLTNVFIGCSPNEKEMAQNSSEEIQNAETDNQEIKNFNPTGFPIVNEKITLQMMATTAPILVQNWEENSFFRRMEELTNINFEFIIVDGPSWIEKKNLAFASGDLPDVFFKANLTKQDEMLYGEQGILVPLEGLIEDYASNITALFEKHPEIKKTITLPSTHIVTLPKVTLMPQLVRLFINQKWLDQLELQEPESLDQFYDVLKEFKENDPNGNGKQDEIPVSLVGIGPIKAMMSAWGLLFDEATNLYSNDDNEIIFSPMQPEFKEALHYLRKLFKEKLLDNECFTQTDQQLKAKGTGEDNLLGVIYTNSPLLQVGQDRHFDYYSITPFKTTDGKQVWPSGSTIATGMFSITEKNKYPEATIRWIDYLYSEEGGQLIWMGKEGEEYKVNNDGTWDWIVKDGDDVTSIRGRATIQPGGKDPYQPELWSKINDKFERHIMATRENVDPYARAPLPSLYLSSESQKRVNSLNADIGAYVDQMIARFITGDISIDSEWDNYIKTLKQMGVEELIEIYQDTYNEYLKK